MTAQPQPEDPPCLIAIDAAAGHSYIAEPGEDAIVLMLTLVDNRRVNVVFAPDRAVLAAGLMANQCASLHKLANTEEQIP